MLGMFLLHQILVRGSLPPGLVGVRDEEGGASWGR
jgi:hypothetical protein